MTMALAIVERPHRGTLEQQYAHVLWLIHALHRQAPMTLLLRGSAASYAVDGSTPEPLRLGDRSWGGFPDNRAAVQRLGADGATMLVCSASLDRLGLNGRKLITGIQPVTEEQIVAITAECNSIWYL